MVKIMRISVDKNSIWYKENCHKYRPYLNGEYCKDCIEADDINGWIIRQKRDEDDKIMVSKWQDYILFEMIFGKVELILSEDCTDEE